MNSIKKYGPLVSRLILGAIYFVFGLNGFLNFIPMKADAMPPEAIKFFEGMMATGYFFPFLKGTETLFGAFLLTNLATPLALVVLAPITLNIVLFHLILTPGIQNAVMPMVMASLHLWIARSYSAKFRPLFFSK